MMGLLHNSLYNIIRYVVVEVASCAFEQVHFNPLTELKLVNVFFFLNELMKYLHAFHREFCIHTNVLTS